VRGRWGAAEPRSKTSPPPTEAPPLARGGFGERRGRAAIKNLSASYGGTSPCQGRLWKRRFLEEHRTGTLHPSGLPCGNPPPQSGKAYSPVGSKSNCLLFVSPAACIRSGKLSPLRGRLLRRALKQFALVCSGYRRNPADAGPP
jgi:hypothetical protein